MSSITSKYLPSLMQVFDFPYRLVVVAEVGCRKKFQKKQKKPTPLAIITREINITTLLKTIKLL